MELWPLGAARQDLSWILSAPLTFTLRPGHSPGLAFPALCFLQLSRVTHLSGTQV